MVDAAGLEAFFFPRSVAVVGASRDPGKPGYQVLLNLYHHFRGAIYPVNRRETRILGLPCFPDVAAVPRPLDLMVVAVPAPELPAVFGSATGRGDVRAAVILTAGLGEMAEELPKALQRQLVDLARRGGIRVLGPNCVGVVNTENRLNTTFATNIPFRPGPVGFVTQSGSLGGALLLLEETHPAPLGYSRWVHVGNMADVDFAELLEYFGADPATRVIAVQLEGLGDGRRFLAAAARVNRIKPVVVLKTGLTQLGSQAAASHTGNLAGTARVFLGALRQAGVLAVETIEELLDAVRALAKQPLPAGNRIYVLTEAGGPGIMAMDELSREPDFTAAPLPPSTVRELTDILPPVAVVDRPPGYTDMSGSATEQQQGAVLRRLLAEPGIDGVVVAAGIPTFLEPCRVAAELAAGAAGAADKPVLVCLVAGNWVRTARQALESKDLPTFDIPQRAARAMRLMMRRAAYLRSRAGQPPWPYGPAGIEVPGCQLCREAAGRGTEGGDALTEVQGRELLARHGFPVGPYALARSAEEAVTRAEELGYPVVLKVVSPDILHKTEVGGVKLGLRDAREVAEAYTAIVESARRHNPHARLEGVLVAPQAAPGVEVVVGALRDPQFGPVVMFGLGGVLVEVLADVAFRVAPLSPEDAADLLASIRGRRLLEGLRGTPPADTASLAGLLRRVGEFMLAHPWIREIDLNPVAVYPSGLALLDVRVAGTGTGDPVL